MTAYADEDFYTKEYRGNPLENLERRLVEASFQVDKMCYGRIRGRGFENLTEYQKDLIRRAVCAHAEFLDQYGEAMNAPMAGYSILDVSISFDKNKIGEMLNGVSSSRDTVDYLNQTGLTVRIL